ncbi:hypothetical protein INR49_007682 [Caranx melampygus]|nr:hypothetical protein INR49_007682 [Caranx melampygus]
MSIHKLWVNFPSSSTSSSEQHLLGLALPSYRMSPEENSTQLPPPHPGPAGSYHAGSNCDRCLDIKRSRQSSRGAGGSVLFLEGLSATQWHRCECRPWSWTQREVSTRTVWQAKSRSELSEGALTADHGANALRAPQTKY